MATSKEAQLKSPKITFPPPHNIGHFHFSVASKNLQKWLPYQILGGKAEKKV